MPVNHHCLTSFPAQKPFSYYRFKFPISVLLCTSDQSLPSGSVESQIELKIDFNGQLSYVCVGISTGKRSIKYLWKSFFFWFPNSTVQIKRPSQADSAIPSNFVLLPKSPDSLQACPEQTGMGCRPFRLASRANFPEICHDFDILYDLLRPCKRPAKWCLPT